MGDDSEFAFAPGPGDLIGTAASPLEPMLGELADNGGPTKTHALLPGSPAIDAGDPAFAPPATDQRGVARPQDGDGDRTARVDIGAVELVSASLAIDVGQHVLLPDTPDQVIPIYVSGGADVQGVVLNVQLEDGFPDVPGSIGDGPNITNVDLVGLGTVFGNLPNTGNNVTESREQIWVVGTSTADGVVPADGVLAYVTIDTTGWLKGDGPWELKIGGTIDGDTNLQSPAGQVMPWIENGVIRISPANPWHNADLPTDVNGDGSVSPIDLLMIWFWHGGSRTRTQAPAGTRTATRKGRR